MLPNASINPRREKHIAIAIFLLVGWMLLDNLDYALLWYDEAATGIVANNIVETGLFGGWAWDGRNLLVSHNGEALNNDLFPASYPPWTALPSALGILIFGKNEIGVRFFHTALGYAAIFIFYFILRFDFSGQQHARLRLLALVLFAFSTQLLLFFRLGRYVPDAVFFSLLTYYCYRQYISGGQQRKHLAIATTATVLSFFNHFAIAVAFSITLAVWHLIYFRKQTSRQQWKEFIIAGAICTVICLSYLIWADIIFTDSRIDYVDSDVHRYQLGWLERKAHLIYWNFRDYILFGLLPFWALVLLIIYFICYVLHKKSKPPTATDNPHCHPFSETKMVIAYVVFLALFLSVSGLIAVRPASVHQFADLRYIFPVFPFSVVMLAAAINLLWHKQKQVAVAFLCLIIFTNIPSHTPFYIEKYGIEFILSDFIEEINRPYEYGGLEVLNYLKQHAKQDETILIEPWTDKNSLQFYLSDKLIFCCSLNDQDGLPKDKIKALNIPIYEYDVIPDWIVVSRSLQNRRRGLFYKYFDSDLYKHVFSPRKHMNPFQRPENGIHSSIAPLNKGETYILKRK